MIEVPAQPSRARRIALPLLFASALLAVLVLRAPGRLMPPALSSQSQEEKSHHSAPSPPPFPKFVSAYPFGTARRCTERGFFGSCPYTHPVGVRPHIALSVGRLSQLLRLRPGGAQPFRHADQVLRC